MSESVESAETVKTVDPAEPDAPVTEEERKQAARLITRLMIGVLAVVLAAGVAIVAGRDPAPKVSKEPAIGPPAGQELATYVERRRLKLRDLDEPRVAVVSFGSYMTEADARARLAGVKVSGLLVAAPGGAPAYITGDLAAWAAAERAQAEADIKELQGMLDTEDKDFKAQFQDDIKRLQRLVNTVQPSGPVVFGALVAGNPAPLKALGKAPGVRLVDFSETADPPKGTRIRGLRPEETVRAGEPLTRPA